MALGQLVIERIERLKKLSIEEIRELPPLTEEIINHNGVSVELHVYREDSFYGRVVIVVKVFRRKFLATMAAAEGFAISDQGQLVELNLHERSTLL